ncbi:MAG: hypothetical protein KF866_07735 [Phycisphaeraceae bacterium]|nr:hypothetical protein [Phycisphaeraceae bacterium]
MLSSKMRIRALIGAGTVAAMCAMPAMGTRVDLLVYENADNADTSVLDLWVDVLPSAGGVDFVFHNDGTDGVAANVYFENTAFSSAFMSNGAITFQSAGVNFAPGGSPGNPAPPGMMWGGAWAGNIFSAGATPPPSMNGLSPGETMTISFDLTGATVADVLDALNSGSFRIAQHVISIGEFSVWTITPAPSALALLGLAAVGRRRR